MKYFYITLISQLIFFHAFGQKIKVINDFRIVNELEVVKSLSDKWELGIGGKCWFEKNASEIDELDLDAGIGYKPIKFLSVELGYRWSKNRNKYDDFITRQRFSGNIKLLAKLKRMKAEYRLCYQNIDDDFFQNDEANPAQHILRNRIQFKYNIRKSKLTPFLLVEHYGQLGVNHDYGLKIKSEAGISWSINNYHNLKIYYRIDRELNNENPYIFYSLGLGYLFEF